MYFFLLVLKVALNFILDIIYKRSRFLTLFIKKDLQFVLYKKDDLIIFEQSLILLPAKANFILKEQRCKRDTFVALGSSIFRIVLILLAKVEALYI